MSSAQHPFEDLPLDLITALRQPSMALNQEMPDLACCFNTWEIARHEKLEKIVSWVVEVALKKTRLRFLYNLVINCHGDEEEILLGHDGIRLSNVHKLTPWRGVVKRIYILTCNSARSVGGDGLLKGIARVVDCDVTSGKATQFVICDAADHTGNSPSLQLLRYPYGHRPPFVGEVYTTTPDGSVSKVGVYGDAKEMYRSNPRRMQSLLGYSAVGRLKALVPWPLGQNKVTWGDRMLSLAPPSMVVNYGAPVQLFADQKLDVLPNTEPTDVIDWIARAPTECFAGVRGREKSGRKKADMIYNLVFNCESDSVWPLRVGSSGFNQANVHLFSSLKGKVDKIFIPISNFTSEILKRNFALEVSRLADCVVIVNCGKMMASFKECAKECYTYRLVPLTHGPNGVQGIVYNKGQDRGLLSGNNFKEVLTLNIDENANPCLKCQLKHHNIFPSDTLCSEDRTTPQARFNEIVFVEDNDDDLNHYCIRSTDNEELGAGAFGQVIKVHSYHWNNQPHHDGYNALKIFHGGLAKSKLDELQIVLTLRHENVLDHIAMGHIRRDQTSFYLGTCILMEYCDGGTLANFVTKNPPLPPAQLVNYTRQLICGLHYLHETVQPKPVIHGDIKGNNILLKERIGATLKICDLDSLTKLTEGSVSYNADLTSKKGTRAFMSPELFAWGKNTPLDDPQSKVGRSTDIWSLGCVVLEMFLRGRILFRRVGQSLVYMDELNECAQIRLLAEGGVPDVPEKLPSPLRQIVLGCLKVTPAERPKAKVLLKLFTRDGGLHDLEDDTAWSTVDAVANEPTSRKPCLEAVRVGTD
ncbi:putative Mitogen-activated protein kinase kinase kinase ANP1 [Hypsibius exemplaris]|uniref:Mitogen-activated protein kinase kinase kinase ANP1 n=1 Tax=Hypsibius exemplaris TaxID=2072580 RepID=A0A9X6NHN1_HYPEX|nr:putative Mitogen-activated protein kinase kinase kinase ANP1 [Hypsibius exemplaris]